jgi:hypothetical protein
LTPTAKPSTPAARPATPVAKPIETPRAPTAKPSTPVAKPSLPIRGDDSPIAKPGVTPAPKPIAKPVDRPAAPTSRPNRPQSSDPIKPADTRKPIETPRGDGVSGKRPEGKFPEGKTPEGKIPEGKIPESKSPEIKSPEVRSPEIKAPEIKAPEIKAPEIKAPTTKTPTSKSPPQSAPDLEVGQKKPRGDDGGSIKPRPTGEPFGKPSEKPTERPSERPTGNPAGDPSLETISADASPLARKPKQFTDDTVYGVPVNGVATGATATTGGPLVYNGSGTTVVNNGSNNTTVVENTVINNYNQYISNVSYANGWNSGGAWSSCGPCPVWQPYNCSDGLSISLGFGSGGFSFGFFYGSSCAPLCSSWCNPWWDGYASYWTCSPYYVGAGCLPWRARWASCWNPYWNVCWSSGWNPCWPYNVCAPAWPVYTPCFTYAPVVCASVVTVPATTIIYTPPVVAAPVVVAPAPLPNPDALWTFLAEGYDFDAEKGFVALNAADPAESAWTFGIGFARAFQGEVARASDMLREAMRTDPSGVLRTSADPRFVARLEALERSLSPAANGATTQVDALLIIAASQAARGDLSGAYFTATTARAEGDRSMGTAAFIAWLEGELRQRI